VNELQYPEGATSRSVEGDPDHGSGCPMQVLLASDGSSDARRAARWLRDAPLPPDTRVSVLTVATLSEPPRGAQTLTELRESVISEARQAVERAARILRKRWPESQTAVTLGDPSVDIVRVAEETRVDMIAVGARGLGRLKRFFVGSTSLAVARYAPCPVVIVRGRPRRTERILVAVDGSDGSRAALRFLSRFEILPDTQVVLTHVLPKSATPGRRGTGEELHEDRRKQWADADALLADMAAVLSNARRPIERRIAEGDPAREIVRSARGRDVDLVVLGARGVGALGRLLLGSVSETVLHHVGRPVMIVRER
jgi:nucleotide-binding universal stress UspA family protein